MALLNEDFILSQVRDLKAVAEDVALNWNSTFYFTMPA